MTAAPHSYRALFYRALRILAVVAVVLLALVGLWAWLMPGAAWRYYSDGISIRRPVGQSVVRHVVWEEPELMPGAFNEATDTYEPCISADGSRMIFTRGRACHNADLFICTWDGKAWGDPLPLSDLNTEQDELGPALADDGRLLYFYSDRAGGLGGYDIWIARWDGFTWVAPSNAGANVNSAFNEYGPALAPGGDRLYYSSNRPRRDLTDAEQRAWKATLREVTLQSDYDIFAVTVIPDAGTHTTALPPLPTFDKGARVAELNSMQDEGQVVITPRGDFLYFSSNREGGQGAFDLYRSRLMHGRILAPENLGPPINSARNDMDPALRLEGFGLVFSSNRAQEDLLDYRLYSTTSRDVFVDVDLSRWTLLWWSLLRVKWWLLILLGALILLTYLVRNFTNAELRHRRTLLHTCLLASALIHALLLFILGFWIISVEVIKTLSDPAMEIAVDLNALAREKISLDLREEITQLPASADTLVVEQVERRLPIPELAPPESIAQPIVARAAVQPFAFEVQPAPQPAPREPLPMETPPTLARLPELDMPPAMLRMDELPPAAPAAPETPPETPTLDAPAQTATPLQPQPAPTLPPSRPPEPAPLPVMELARRSSIPAAEAVPLPEPPDPRLPSPAELRVRLPEVESLLTRLSLDERSELAAGEETLIASLPAPDATAVQRAEAPPAPEGPVDTQVQLPQILTDAAMVSSVATSRVVEVELSTTLRPSDSPYTNLSTLRLAALVEMEMQHPQAVTGAVSDIRLAAPVPAAATPDDAPQPGRPERLDVQPRPPAPPTFQAAAVAAAPADEAPAPETRLTPPERVVAELPVVAALATPRLETAHGRAAGARPAVVQLADDPHRAAPTQPSASGPTARAVAVEAALAAVPLSRPNPADITLVAPAERSLPLPQLAGLGATATIQLPSLEKAEVLRLETSELASVPHYVLRRPENRGKILTTLGGDKESEETVQRSLSWLLNVQEPDGHWDIEKYGGDKRHDVAATGLALLCFFGWGATHTEVGPYHQATLNAIEWLLDQMKPDGDLRSKDMYDQGIATMALTEAYGLTKDEKLREPAQQAVAFILKAQHQESGGWRYAPGDPGDTSVFGWQLMALESARMAGLDVPQEALDRAGQWLDKVGGGQSSGLYGYQGRSPAPAMVAEGMFCRQLLGQTPDKPMMRESAAYLNTRPPDTIDYYYIYYGTLALFQHQGAVWEEWNSHMKKALMAKQRSEGQYTGSWDPVGSHGDRMGRIVSTAMATLSLEVYYRYLPLYGLRPAAEP